MQNRDTAEDGSWRQKLGDLDPLVLNGGRHIIKDATLWYDRSPDQRNSEWCEGRGILRGPWSVRCAGPMYDCLSYGHGFKPNYQPENNIMRLCEAHVRAWIAERNQGRPGSGSQRC